jgi:hypothetical protein
MAGIMKKYITTSTGDYRWNRKAKILERKNFSGKWHSNFIQPDRGRLFRGYAILLDWEVEKFKQPRFGYLIRPGCVGSWPVHRSRNPQKYIGDIGCQSVTKKMATEMFMELAKILDYEVSDIE